MDWLLYDNDPRHERVKDSYTFDVFITFNKNKKNF